MIPNNSPVVAAAAAHCGKWVRTTLFLAIASAATTLSGCGDSSDHDNDPVPLPDAVDCAASVEPGSNLPTPPAPESIVLERISPPATIKVTYPRVTFLDNDTRILFQGEYIAGTPATGTQIFTMALDGSDVRCTTCDHALDPALAVGEVFEDGKRFTMEKAPASGSFLEDSQKFIAECEPSLSTCTSLTVVPLELTNGGSAVLGNRELRVSPDNVSLAWTQLRTDTGAAFAYGQLHREDAKYTIQNPYILQNGYVVGTEEQRALSAHAVGGELKNFADGGASIIYIGSVAGLNFDIMKLDIASGQIERVSRDAEYDEEVGQSPDGESYIVYSTRTASTPRLAVFAQIERPYFASIGFGASVGEMRNDFDGQRNFQAFLFDKHGSRQGYTGQLIREPTPEYPATVGVPRWSKDGKMVLFYEQLDSSLWSNANDGRIIIARLVDRAPISSPLPIVTAPDPSSWAQTFDSYHADGNFNGTWQGKNSGSAVVEHTGSTFIGSMKVTYNNYSDDGFRFLNGTEIFDMDILAESTYDADVVLSGCQQGSLKGSLMYDLFGKKSSGSIQSILDGITLNGPPQQ